MNITTWIIMDHVLPEGFPYLVVSEIREHPQMILNRCFEMEHASKIQKICMNWMVYNGKCHLSMDDSEVFSSRWLPNWVRAATRRPPGTLGPGGPSGAGGMGVVPEKPMFHGKIPWFPVMFPYFPTKLWRGFVKDVCCCLFP